MYFGEVGQWSSTRAVSRHKLLGNRAKFIGGLAPKNPNPSAKKKHELVIKNIIRKINLIYLKIKFMCYDVCVIFF